ncbi:BTB/POZ domain-containing protein 9-like [Oscarella lobularis]|uniref:BTB/POZ domain-containing protein 9-like n=1 Tax=Oscarella lobularis TaxID=121494 RepID=UPI00331436EF
MDRMLYGSMLEGTESEIELPEADEVAFEALLRYFYTGKTEIDPSKITELVKLCDYYNVAYLKEKCSQWLQSNLNPDNVCLYMDFARQYDDDLYARCRCIATVEASKVLASKAFAESLSGEQALAIVQFEALQVAEYQIFEAVSRWTEHHKDSSHVEKLIDNIRFGLIPTAYLVGSVQESGLVNSKVILSAVTYQHQPKSPVLQLPSPLFAEKRMVLTFDSSLAIGCTVSEKTAYSFGNVTTPTIAISREKVLKFLEDVGCKIQFRVHNLSSTFTYSQYSSHYGHQQQQVFNTGTLSVHFKTERQGASNFGIQFQICGAAGSEVSVSVPTTGQSLGSYSSSQLSFVVSASKNKTIDFEFPGFSLTVKGEDYGCPAKPLSERGDLYLELSNIAQSSSIECSLIT